MALTEEEQQVIINAVKHELSHLQYVGARYVPIFGRKGETSADWDNTKPYEPLTIVLHDGNSYTSKQYTPSGIDILDTTFWVETGNYNAQIEAYRQEVLRFDSRITENAMGVEDNAKAIEAEAEERSKADTAINNDISQNIKPASFLLEGSKLAFLGDSITIGQANTSGENYPNPWPKVLSDLVKAGQMSNFAVGGATAASGSPASSNALAQARLIDQEYDYVFIMFVTNDYGYEMSEDAVKTGLRNAINQIQVNYQNTKVIGVIPPYMPSDNTQNSLGYTALDYKNFAYRVYNEKNCPVIDFTGGMGLNANNWLSHIWDTTSPQLHPNEETHKEMGDFAAKCLSVNTVKPYLEPLSLQAEIGTFSPGVSAAEASQWPSAWLDEAGNAWFIFGEGIKVEPSASVSGETLITYSDKFKSAGNTYGPAFYINSSGVPTAFSVAVSGNKLIGVGARPPETFTILGQICVPKAYLSNPRDRY